MSKKQIPWNKNLKMNSVQKSKMNFSGLKLGRGYFKGKTDIYSKETLKKMSIAKLGICGKNHPMFGKKNPMSDETKNKLRLYVGVKKYNYIKDRTQLKKSEKKHLDSRYREWMFVIKNRDNWKCVINNSDCNGRLEAHHIFSWRSYPGLRYDVNNGITLCKFHHPRKRDDEQRLISKFKKIISKNKNMSDNELNVGEEEVVVTEPVLEEGTTEEVVEEVKEEVVE